MLNILKKHHDMNIIGQGGKIILFMLPALIAAIIAHIYLPSVAALPATLGFLKYAGIVLFVPGLALWGTAIVQLLTAFTKGRLVTTGAYGIVRNPIYASAVWFILPAISLLTMTWVYLVVSVCLYLGVIIFIRKEEEELKSAFGKEYEVYLTKVHRLIPFLKP